MAFTIPRRDRTRDTSLLRTSRTIRGFWASIMRNLTHYRAYSIGVGEMQELFMYHTVWFSLGSQAQEGECTCNVPQISYQPIILYVHLLDHPPHKRAPNQTKPNQPIFFPFLCLHSRGFENKGKLGGLGFFLSILFILSASASDLPLN